MAKWGILIFFAATALVSCTDVEDNEQKKRGAGKGTSLNAITTGAQKQDYTYNVYSPNPSSQSSSSASYQSQVPNSFYPSQTANQYYSTPNAQSDTSSYSQQQQPQLNLLPPSTNSQFVPLNFISSPGYQSKYQIVPSKSNGNIQLTVYQHPGSYPAPQIMPYSQPLLLPSSSSQVNPQTYNIPQPQSQFNIAPNYSQLPLSGSYSAQPSTMLLFAQPNLSQLYNNLLYPNPVQTLFNYYPSNAQSKYSVQYVPQGSSTEYDKIQGSVGQSVSKEDNDIAHSNEYTLPSDSSSSYKTVYSTTRNTYSKL